MSAPQVYAAIAAVTADLAKHGITKDRKNSQQGYAFRGIDDVYNALAPVLAARKLCVIPRILERETIERQTKGGGALFNVTVRAQFDFVSADDGSRHEVVTYGEAMDSADKATNKAMSAAYKYAAFMTFCIPTEGDNDADATTHEIVAKPQPPKKAPPAKAEPSDLEKARAWAATMIAKLDAARMWEDVQALVGSPALTKGLEKLHTLDKAAAERLEAARQTAVDRAVADQAPAELVYDLENAQ